MHLHGVGATDSCGEGRDRRAQHVHPRVPLRHHRQRCGDVNGRRPGVTLPHHHLSHAGPDLARGTQFCDRGELVVVDGEPERDLSQRGRNRQTTLDQMAHTRHACRDRGAELPGGVGAQVVEHRSVHGDCSHVAVVGAGLRRCRDDVLEVGRGPAGQWRDERIGAQVDRKPGPLFVIESGHQGQHGVSGGTERVADRLDHDGDEVEVHAVEETLEIGGGHRVAGVTDAQHQCTDALGQPQQDRPVGLGDARVGRRVDVGDLPPGLHVTQCVAAPHVGPVPGEGWFSQLVGAGVQGPDRETVVGVRIEQTLRLGAQIGGVPLRGLRQNARNRGAPSVQIGVCYPGRAGAGCLHSHQAK